MNRHAENQERELLEEISDIVTSAKLAKVKEQYEEAGRHYHSWDHALDVIAAVTALPLPHGETRQAHLLAALFHDVVYVPGAKDNEARSADLLDEMCPGSVLGRELIMATETHAVATRENTDPRFWDFMDCDILAIALPCWPLAIANDWNVGAELVPIYGLEASAAGRVQFLTNWLAKPSVFLGDFYGSTHEWQARKNLTALIKFKGHDFSAVL